MRGHLLCSADVEKQLQLQLYNRVDFFYIHLYIAYLIVVKMVLVVLKTWCLINIFQKAWGNAKQVFFSVAVFSKDLNAFMIEVGLKKTHRWEY